MKYLRGCWQSVTNSSNSFSFSFLHSEKTSFKKNCPKREGKKTRLIVQSESLKGPYRLVRCWNIFSLRNPCWLIATPDKHNGLYRPSLADILGSTGRSEISFLSQWVLFTASQTSQVELSLLRLSRSSPVFPFHKKPTHSNAFTAPCYACCGTIQKAYRWKCHGKVVIHLRNAYYILSPIDFIR